jgi:hypothetical protein
VITVEQQLTTKEGSETILAVRSTRIEKKHEKLEASMMEMHTKEIRELEVTIENQAKTINSLTGSKDSNRIDTWKKKASKAEGDLKESEKRVKALESDLTKSKGKIDTMMKAKEDAAASKKKGNDANFKKLEADLKKSVTDLTNEKDQVKILKAEIDKLTMERSNVNDVQSKADAVIRKLTDDLASAKEENIKLVSKIEGMTLMSSNATASTELNRGFTYRNSDFPHSSTSRRPSSNPPSHQSHRYREYHDDIADSAPVLVLPPPPRREDYAEEDFTPVSHPPHVNNNIPNGRSQSQGYIGRVYGQSDERGQFSQLPVDHRQGRGKGRGQFHGQFERQRNGQGRRGPGRGQGPGQKGYYGQQRNQGCRQGQGLGQGQNGLQQQIQDHNEYDIDDDDEEGYYE